MKRFFILSKALTLSYAREPMVVFWNLVFPVFLLVIYRFVFGEMAVNGAAFMQWVVPGVVVLNILSFGMLGGSAFMTGMRTTGVLWRLKATPTPAVYLFGAFMVVNVLTCLAQTALVLGFAAVAFGWSVSFDGLILSLPMILLTVVASVALGAVHQQPVAKPECDACRRAVAVLRATLSRRTGHSYGEYAGMAATDGAVPARLRHRRSGARAVDQRRPGRRRGAQPGALCGLHPGGWPPGGALLPLADEQVRGERCEGGG